MGEILKFVAVAFLILLILTFALPLLWLVIQIVCGLFGEVVSWIGNNLLSIILIIASIVGVIIASKD